MVRCIFRAIFNVAEQLLLSILRMSNLSLGQVVNPAKVVDTWKFLHDKVPAVLHSLIAETLHNPALI